MIEFLNMIYWNKKDTLLEKIGPVIKDFEECANNEKRSKM
jgi:nitrate reductase assembly molybdenum cofactor insertion protein NarJ